MRLPRDCHVLAAAVGITLTAANRIFLMEPCVNPAEEILNSVIYGGSGAIAVCGGEVRSGLMLQCPPSDTRSRSARTRRRALPVARRGSPARNAHVRRTMRCTLWTLRTAPRCGSGTGTSVRSTGLRCIR